MFCVYTERLQLSYRKPLGRYWLAWRQFKSHQQLEYSATTWDWDSTSECIQEQTGQTVVRYGHS